MVNGLHLGKVITDQLHWFLFISLNPRSYLYLVSYKHTTFKYLYFPILNYEALQLQNEYSRVLTSAIKILIVIVIFFL